MQLLQETDRALDSGKSLLRLVLRLWQRPFRAVVEIAHLDAEQIREQEQIAGRRAEQAVFAIVYLGREPAQLLGYLVLGQPELFAPGPDAFPKLDVRPGPAAVR